MKTSGIFPLLVGIQEPVAFSLSHLPPLTLAAEPDGCPQSPNLCQTVSIKREVRCYFFNSNARDI